MQDPNSPEGLAAAERRYIDSDPEVCASSVILAAATASVFSARDKLAAAVDAEDLLDAIAAAIVAAQVGRAALDAFRGAEGDARRRWRGHVALGFD